MERGLSVRSERRAAKPIPAWLPPAASTIIRCLGATWSVQERFAPAIDPHRADRPSRCVYLFWHRTILLASYVYRDLGICVAQSHHRDGEIAARIAARLGHLAVRGSSSRGATGLVRSMIEVAERERCDIAFTPDGPRGPPERTKPGALYLASRLGWPAVPVALAARPCKQLRSWDRFIVPWPFARVAIVAAEPLALDREATTEQLAELCPEVDRRIAAAERVAEELVA